MKFKMKSHKRTEKCVPPPSPSYLPPLPLLSSLLRSGSYFGDFTGDFMWKPVGKLMAFFCVCFHLNMVLARKREYFPLKKPSHSYAS